MKMQTACTLNEQARCCYPKCVGCGWNLSEAEMREKLLADNGLTLCKDGKSRLIIKRKESEK